MLGDQAGFVSTRTLQEGGITVPGPSDNANQVKIYVDDATYLALRHRCESADRSMSQHIRHLVKCDLRAFIENEKGSNGATEGRGE